MSSRIERGCREKGLRMTRPRVVIAEALSSSSDRHLDARQLHLMIRGGSHGVSLATVYRTLRQFEILGVIESHALGDRVPHYEPARVSPHDHLIDVETGQVVEFMSTQLEALFQKAARDLGYRLVSYRLELFGEKTHRDRSRGFSLWR